MARPREFNENEAIEGALKIFWKNGYSGTNLPDLLQAMNLTRGSFYAAFDDKHTTYLKALKRYEDVHLSKMLDDMLSSTAKPYLERIQILFNQIDLDSSPDCRKGCILCNAASEFGGSDPEVKQSIVRMINAIRQTLSTVLEEYGIKKTSADRKANALLQLYLGGQILGKLNDNLPDIPSAIRGIVDDPSL